MMYEIGQMVQYYADDTEKFYQGVVKNVSENFIKPDFTQYQVSFLGGDFWLYEIDLLEVK